MRFSVPVTGATRWAVFFFCLFVCVRAGAQTVISGRIFGEDGKPPRKALAQLFADSYGQLLAETVTDADGRFRLSTDRQGLAVLKLSAVGHLYSTVLLPLPQAAPLTITARLKRPAYKNVDWTRAILVVPANNADEAPTRAKFTLQDDGTFAAEATTKETAVGVHINTTVAEVNNFSLPDASTYRLNPNWKSYSAYYSFQAVVTPVSGNVRIVIDPAKLKSGRREPAIRISGLPREFARLQEAWQLLELPDRRQHPLETPAARAQAWKTVGRMRGTLEKELAWLNLAVTLEAGKSTSADDARKILAVVPPDSPAWSLAGSSLVVPLVRKSGAGTEYEPYLSKIGNPDRVDVMALRGELAAKAGDDSKALEYLVSARLRGSIPPESVAALESVYKKIHDGSMEGLETMLDREYNRLFPNPLKVEEHQPTEKRSGRVVLAEIFTGAGCPPCVAADLAFDAAMERYSRKDLAVVAYHVHVPRPDPMTNPDTEARYKVYQVSGVPTFAIDGKTTIGGGGRERTKEVYDGPKGFNQDIEKDLELPAEAGLRLTADLNSGEVRASVLVNRVQSESQELKVQIALVEKRVVYSGENGIRFHPMVVRALGGPRAEGFPLDPKQPGSFDEAFDLAKVSSALQAHLDDYEAKGHRGESFKFIEKKYQIDPARLAVVAFVQDDKTKHVLQAAYVDLSPSPAVVTVSAR